jgi:TonB family protein
MVKRSAFGAAHWLLLAAALFVQSVCGQSNEPAVLTHLAKDSLDALASRSAQRIREANLAEKEPKILVIDFFRGSTGRSSHLGTLLADRFSEALFAYSAGLRVLDRKILKDYLIENWTTLEDLQSVDVCLRIGRHLGATGVILGTLYEENGQISLTVHLEGFGPEKTEDVFAAKDERARFPLTEEMHTMLFEPGPDYTRKADDIPNEPGVFKTGSGVGEPRCIRCPLPEYSDPARAAKFQGTVRLSIVVTDAGEVTSIYVLKGAPFGLIAQATQAMQDWRFEPALKDGKSVPVRVPVEVTFRIY